MRYLATYRIDTDLPSYPAGAVIFHEYEVTNHLYRPREPYEHEGIYYTKWGDKKNLVHPYLALLIPWCREDIPDRQGFVTKLAEEVMPETGDAQKD